MPQVGTQPTITIQPSSALIPAGTTRFNTTALPAGYSTVSLTLPRTAGWADSAGIEILELVAEFSDDGGVTFPYAEGFGVSGGVITIIDRNTGQPVTVTSHNTIRLIPSPTPPAVNITTVRGRLVNRTGSTLTALSVAIALN